MRERFLEIPFSVLDTKQGHWQKRKEKWRELGLESEVGREGGLMKYSKTILSQRKYIRGSSIFDEALTELMYHWFCPEQGKILDPFAGGSVRGIIAHYLNRQYVGIELREEQVVSNRNQAQRIIPDNQPTWHMGDSDKVLDSISDEFDFIFTCPPYFSLEVYSELPDDLSNMSDEEFIVKYESIIKKSCDKLKKGAYACIVVGDVRDKNGYYKDFITTTKLAFYKAGMRLYNEAILLQGGLNLAGMRVNRIFTASKKLVKVHQNVLIFKKPK